MIPVLISMGSNVDKERNLPAAVAALHNHPAVNVLAASPTYVTAAIGATGKRASQPAFHNAALWVETELPPEALRTLLRAIEAQLGRVRGADRFAPRPIDLDIAFYGNQVVEVDGKVIPDPDVLRFAHVALPLAAVAPGWLHPEHGRPLSAIAGDFDATEMEIIR
jgi:2-amino-4-hydroxy-6-hydroxymethyldihydropteridine diphosphokinase